MGKRSPATLALAAILVAAATLYRLGDSPPGLFIDEVAISLTARGLGESGQDLVGSRWPLYPRSFPDRDYPTPINPVFPYSSIPFAMAGPGAWTARLPAVCWLWIAAAGIGLLSMELTRDRNVALFAAVSAALSPWLFVLGRVGWEAVTFPAVTALAFAMLFRAGRTDRGRDYSAAGALFGLSLYTYSTARLLVPLTLATVALIYWRRSGERSQAIRFALAFVVLAAPFALYVLRHPTLLTFRFEEMSVWSQPSERGSMGVVSRFVANYAGYFGPRFLFVEGDINPRHSTGRGMLLWAWAPLMALGLWQAWRRRGDPAVRAVIAALLLAPIGASLTQTDRPHAIRSISTIVFWAALAAMGFQQALEWSRGRRAAVSGAILGLTLLNAGVILADYFGPYRERAYDAFDAGKNEVLREAFGRREERHIYVPASIHSSPRQSVYLAYWGRLPATLWPEKGLDAFGIHAWGGGGRNGSLVVIDPRQDSPPAGARQLLSVEGPDGRRRYGLYAN